MPDVDGRDALTTYRYLRIATTLLVVLLAASVIHQIYATEPNCWLGSISAYYYTSARAVFVACLCAIGAFLVIYQGNTPREDLVLNVSGFLAFVVALVPTPLGDLVVNPNDPVGSRDEPLCKRSNVPTEKQLETAIENNVLAFLVMVSLALIVVVWFRHKRSQRLLSVSTGVLGSSVVVGWVLFVTAPDLIQDEAHIVAAVAMFGGIVLVVAMNAFALTRLDPDARGAPGWSLVVYRVIFAAMVLAIAVLGPVALTEHYDHAIFWLEASLIALFAAFWFTQTIELWNVEYRGADA